MPDSNGDDDNDGNGGKVSSINGIPIIALTIIIGTAVIYLLKKTKDQY